MTPVKGVIFWVVSWRNLPENAPVERLKVRGSLSNGPDGLEFVTLLAMEIRMAFAMFGEREPPVKSSCASPLASVPGRTRVLAASFGKKEPMAVTCVENGFGKILLVGCAGLIHRQSPVMSVA